MEMEIKHRHLYIMSTTDYPIICVLQQMKTKYLNKGN